MTGFNSSN